VIRMTRSTSRIVKRPLPQDDPVRRLPNATRARELLDWEPHVPLAEGLEKTIAYFEKLLVDNDVELAKAG
jgi:UDP-glucuronate decarboxylase